MTQRTIQIGTVDFPAAKQRVFRDADIVEISNAREIPPKRQTATKWREAAPARFAYSVQMPRFLFDSPVEGTPLPGDLREYGAFRVSEENLNLWNRAAQFAEALGASALVLLTPPEFTPTRSHVTAFTRFIETVSKENFRIVWEPRGPWEHARAARLARDNKLVLSIDPLRDSPVEGDLGYFRLGPFASFGTRLGIYDLERLSEAVEMYSKAICVFATANALDDARNLKKILSDSAG